MPFDPYYKWLGIPPEEQPPNFYRLLGLSLFEQNPDAIDSAADRQMRHVRTFQAGPQGAESQRLLNEIAAARVILLDALKKRTYDEQLRAPYAAPSIQAFRPMVVEVPASVMSAVPVPPGVPPTSETGIRVQPREPSAVARRPSKDMTVEIAKIVGGGIAGIVLATLLLRLGFGIDMTGLFPVTAPEPPPSVAQRTKKSVPRTSPEIVGFPAVDGEKKHAGPLAEEMEEYEEQTPGGVVKKKKKRKPKKRQPSASSEVPIIQAAPAHSDSPPSASPSESSVKLPEENPTWQVTSASLMPNRLPIPSDAERQAAEQQLEQVYQLSKLDDQAAKLSKAVELLALGCNRAAKPAERWTILKTAAELAADGGDSRIVAQAMNLLAQTFESDFLPEEASLLAKSGRDVRTAAQMDALVQASRLTIQLALAEQQFTLARDLAAAVREASNRPAGAKYRKFIYDGQKEIVRQQKEWYDCQTELAKLAAKPNDPIASANVAKWWILERGDWDAALLYLSKTGEPLVRAAADRDLSKGPDRLAIANAWFDAGTAGDGNPLWLVRAQEWYVAIDKSLVSGLDGALVDRRLEELRQKLALQPLVEQIHRGRGAARTSKQLAPVVRRHCMLLMPLDEADHFHDGKNWLVTDRSGQFNHGTVYGARPAPGQAGTALDFNGPDHYVECPDQPGLNPTEAISVCAWARQRTVLNSRGADDVLSKEEWGGGTGRGFALRLDEGRPKFNFGSGPDWLWTQAPQSPGLETWYHLAAIYDGQSAVLLVNGVEVGSQPTNKSISISPQPLRIGRGPFAQDRRFNGTIDEVAVFDMALTAADLQVVIHLGRAGRSLSQ